MSVTGSSLDTPSGLLNSSVIYEEWSRRPLGGVADEY
jgi:hypothetical protein